MRSCAGNQMLMEASPLVIGYGNTLRGDDGIGVIAAQELAILLPDVHVELTQQLMPELMEPISRAAKVVFIDAALDGIPGTVTYQLVSPDRDVLFTHTISPSGLLAGAKALYGTAPSAFLITVTGEKFDLDETLSDMIWAVLPTVIAMAQKLLII
jgi:hydrogenase maturation protease